MEKEVPGSEDKSPVHWRGGVSETYLIEALKFNLGQSGISGLAYGPDGSLWVGIWRRAWGEVLDG